MNNEKKYEDVSIILPFIICGLASLFYLYEFFLRIIPTAMTHQLMSDFDIGAPGLGLMSALFFYGYTPMQIPVGILYDRFGPRNLLTFAILICTAAAIIFSLTHNYYVAIAARFLMGFGGSFAYIGSLVLVGRWFHAKFYAFSVGLVQFLGSTGAILGAGPFALAAVHFGWRPTVFWTGGVGLALGIAFWFLIRTHPSRSQNMSQQNKEKHHLLKDLKDHLKNIQIWWISVYAFCSWLPITVFASLWGTPFLIAAYHVSNADAAGAITFAWIGTAVGGPILGAWSNYTRNRRLPLAISAALGLFTALLIIYFNHLPWFILCILLFLYGCAASAQALSFAVVADITPHTRSGTAIGFNNMAVIAGGLTFLPLVGVFLKMTWNGMMDQGTPIYSVVDYHIALFVIPICSLIGLITSLFLIKETHCRPYTDA